MAPAGPAAQARPELVACADCDALYRRPVLASRDVARCTRCGAVLGRGHFLGAQGQAALAAAAMLTLAIASATPIVRLEFKGIHVTATLGEAIRLTWQAGEPGVAVLAALTAFVFPLVAIALRLAVLWPLALAGTGTAQRQAGPGTVLALRLLHGLMRWSMVEVFMLGVLVAVVRSAGITSLVLGPGLFAFAALTVLLTALHASGLHGLWQMLDRPGGPVRAPAAPDAAAARSAPQPR